MHFRCAGIVVASALWLAAWVNVGCGNSGKAGSPSDPAPTTPTASVPNLAGNWTGTIDSDRAAFPTRPISAQIVQTADCVDGAWKTVTTE